MGVACMGTMSHPDKMASSREIGCADNSNQTTRLLINLLDFAELKTPYPS